MQSALLTLVEIRVPAWQDTIEYIRTPYLKDKQKAQVIMSYISHDSIPILRQAKLTLAKVSLRYGPTKITHFRLAQHFFVQSLSNPGF